MSILSKQGKKLTLAAVILTSESTVKIMDKETLKTPIP